jgi:hypothetical protein
MATRSNAAEHDWPAGRGVQALVYAMIIVVLVGDFIKVQLALPRYFVLMPEVVSVVAAVIVIVRLPLDRFRSIDPRIFFILILLLLELLAGAIANTLEPGVVISGVRAYLKMMPFFLLPLLVKFDDEALKKQMFLITSILLLQLPLAWQQRVATFAGGSGLTGDLTFGTLMLSGNLSITVWCAAAVCLALKLRHQMNLTNMLALFVLTLPCSMINETKVTVVLMPLALLTPMILSGDGSAMQMAKRTFVGLVLLAVVGTVFVKIYDYFIVDRWGYGLVEFFTREGRLEGYMEKDSQIGGTAEVGRIDSMTLPFKAAKGDPVLTMLGYGMGNVSQSALGQGFTGEYFIRYGQLVGPNVSRVIWELGILGLIFVFVLLYLIFKETMAARRAEGFTGAFAVGWTAVVIIMSATMFYANTMESVALSYLFWFYSGVVCAAAMRVRRQVTIENNAHAQANMPEPTLAGTYRRHAL